MLIKQPASWMWQVLSTLLSPVSFHLASAHSSDSELPFLAPSNGTCQSSISRFEQHLRFWPRFTTLTEFGPLNNWTDWWGKLCEENASWKFSEFFFFLGPTDVRNVEFLYKWHPQLEMRFLMPRLCCIYRYKKIKNDNNICHWDTLQQCQILNQSFVTKYLHSTTYTLSLIWLSYIISPPPFPHTHSHPFFLTHTHTHWHSPAPHRHHPRDPKLTDKSHKVELIIMVVLEHRLTVPNAALLQSPLRATWK